MHVQEFVQTMEAAAQLGVEAQELTSVLEGVRKRDADMGKALQVCRYHMV